MTREELENHIAGMTDHYFYCVFDYQIRPCGQGHYRIFQNHRTGCTGEPLWVPHYGVFINREHAVSFIAARFDDQRQFNPNRKLPDGVEIPL